MNNAPVFGAVTRPLSGICRRTQIFLDSESRFSKKCILRSGSFGWYDRLHGAKRVDRRANTGSHEHVFADE